MRVIIAGSRTITSPLDIRHAIFLAEMDRDFVIDEVVCGYARGADMLGKDWADSQGIPVYIMPAGWMDADGDYDRAAGFKRNARMAQYADALIAIWDGRSKGTYNMVKTMYKSGKPMVIHLVEDL